MVLFAIFYILPGNLGIFKALEIYLLPPTLILLCTPFFLKFIHIFILFPFLHVQGYIYCQFPSPYGTLNDSFSESVLMRLSSLCLSKDVPISSPILEEYFH